jgi:putative intracellular protease/amidase
MPRVLIPLPDRDFDTTEAAIPWHYLTQAGHEVVFATERTSIAACDPRVLEGVIFGQLGAEADARAAYHAMVESDAFQHPIAWADIVPQDYAGFLLPGGHAAGMRQYLGSPALQSTMAECFALGRPFAAVCHGVLVLARARGVTGRSVLHGFQSTCLPAYMERLAFWLTAWKLGRYYRTYPDYVETEVRAALAQPGDFQRGPITLFAKSTGSSDRGGFVVEDRHYLSARWPGDVHLLARRFLARLQQA